MKRTVGSTSGHGKGERFRVERRGAGSETRNWQPLSRAGFHVVGRKDGDAPESLTEKQTLMPRPDNDAPRDHAWALGRFACELMAEHAYFFTLLMPPELAKPERLQSIRFQTQFEKLCHRLDAKGPPPASEVRAFARDLGRAIRPFIEFKRANHRAQISGALESLVWPLFFDHTAREAERWVQRLDAIAGGEVKPERKEVVDFWAEIMDDHFRFIAHMLDPNEHTLVRKAFQNSASFQTIRGARHGVAALVGTPKTMPEGEDPATIRIIADEVLEFKTDTVRQLEAGKIQSIINPVLGDHVRREAAWFVDELKRIDL